MSNTTPGRYCATENTINNWIQVTEYDVINPSGGKGIMERHTLKNLAIGV